MNATTATCGRWLICWLAISMTALTQVPSSAPSPSFSVRSQLVVLDAVVTDSHGQPVPGLSQQDFTVFEDNQPRDIRSFEGWNANPDVPPMPTMDSYGRVTWGDGVALTIFVLDELNTPFNQTSFCAEKLRTYLLAQPAQLSTPSMLMTVSGTGLRTLALATRDRDLLLHALKSRAGALPSAHPPLELVAESFAMLRQIAISSQGSHAHTNMVWIGRGFPTLDPNDFADKDALGLRNAIKDTTNLLIGAHITLYQVNPITVDERMDDSSADSAQAAGAGVARGLSNTAALDMLDTQFGFNSFVQSTGGELYYGRNDLDHFLADAVRRGADSYALSFVPLPETAGPDFHSIRIVMKNPSLHVRTRTGFYRPHAAEQPNKKDLGFDMKQAATGTLSYPAIGVRITSTKREGHQLIIHYRLEDRGLTWNPRSGQSDGSTILMLLASLDKDRQIVNSVASELNLAVKSPSDVATSHVDGTERLELTSKSRSVRLVVRDASGRIGTTELDAAALMQINNQ